MKHLRVKTGIVVPSRPSFVARFDKPQRQVMFPSAGLPTLPVKFEHPGANATVYIPVEAPRCTSKPSCVEKGLPLCWYCLRAGAR